MCEVQCNLSSDLHIFSGVCATAERLLCGPSHSTVVQREETSVNNTHFTPHFLSFSIDTQTESHYSYVDKETRARLKKSFGMQEVLHDDRKARYFTGVHDRELFVICFNFIGHVQLLENVVIRLALEEQFLLVLVKLSLGITDQFLAHLFNISLSSIGNIFCNWIPKMYERFRLLKSG